MKREKVKPVVWPIPIDEIQALSKTYPAPYRQLFIACYLYGCRIGEALQLQRESLRLGKDSRGRDVLVADLLTEKNKVQPTRSIPAILDGPNLTPFQQVEAQLTQELDEYRHSVEKDLFPGVSRFQAYTHFSKQKISVKALVTSPVRRFVEIHNFRVHPHYLRHCRLSHLREQYKYDSGDLVQYAGWTDPRPATTYIKLDYRHLADAME